MQIRLLRFLGRPTLSLLCAPRGLGHAAIAACLDGTISQGRHARAVLLRLAWSRSRLRRQLSECLALLVAEGGHLDVEVGEAGGTVSGPADEGGVVDVRPLRVMLHPRRLSSNRIHELPRPLEGLESEFALHSVVFHAEAPAAAGGFEEGREGRSDLGGIGVGGDAEGGGGHCAGVRVLWRCSRAAQGG